MKYMFWTINKLSFMVAFSSLASISSFKIHSSIGHLFSFISLRELNSFWCELLVSLVAFKRIKRDNTMNLLYLGF